MIQRREHLAFTLESCETLGISSEHLGHEKLLLQRHQELNEKWVQDRIAEDPSILALGDVVLKHKERIQPRAGRLDLYVDGSLLGRSILLGRLGATVNTFPLVAAVGPELVMTVQPLCGRSSTS